MAEGNAAGRVAMSALPLPSLAAGLALLALSGCGLAEISAPDAWPGAWIEGDSEGRAAEAAPEQRSETWLALGMRLLEEGDDQNAGRAFIRSLRVEGPSAAAFTGAGIAASHQGLLSQAIRHFKHASEIDPHFAAAHNNLGVALHAQGKFRAAERAFRAAYRLADGDRAEIAKNLAMTEMALAEIGAEPEATTNILTALAVDDDNRLTKAGIGKVQRVGLSAYRLGLGPESDSL